VDDLYATLGVSRTASADEIRKAYRKLARVHHPDANPDDPKAEERFKEISHAYDVLSDPDKRREYDRGPSFFGGNGPRPGAGTTGGGGFGDFADIFSSIFRGGARGGRTGQPLRGQDVEVAVNVSFEQAMRGLQLPVTVEKRSACPTCKGSGAKPGTAPRLCPECNGRGVRGRDLGAFALSEPCPRCNGNGTVVEQPCETCGGAGTKLGEERLRVRIPAGVKDGTKIRLRGKGEAGVRGGPPGDLLVVTHVAPSVLYARQGDDLVLEVPVTFAEAALGAKVEVPTIDGPISLTVPAGSASGKSLRVRGKGAPRVSGGGRGDLIARLRVDVPPSLTKTQREALERFANLDRRNPRESLFTAAEGGGS
jgi:molecular chaperone DnaJ